MVSLCTNTGTYLDVPFHRYDDGYDLAALDLERVAGVPGVVLDRRGERTVDLAAADLEGCAGKAVIVHTDHSLHWGTDAYFTEHPHLSAASAQALVAAGVACVGIDSLNIDGTTTRDGAATGERHVHSILLAAGIPIIEQLTGCAARPVHVHGRSAQDRRSGDLHRAGVCGLEGRRDRAPQGRVWSKA